MSAILIVDDIENNRYLLEKLLAGYGYNTLSAKNGAEALAAARKFRPDLIITDILMPVMDGFELCRQWKADPKLKDIPFIFYTATYTDPKDEKFALDLGADKFIIKPQQPEAFIEIIKQAFEKAQVPSKARKPLGDEMEVLREYNETLFRKLEKKVMNLEDEIQRREAAEKKLNMSIEALEKSNSELERFADATSHDLQEPMREISNYVQLLKKKHSHNLDGEAMEYIDAAIRAAARMIEMIKGIIDFSRVGRAEKDFVPVNLNDVVDEAMDTLRHSITASKAVISAIELPAVSGDKTQLYRLFLNLLGNSLKFAKKGEDPEIKISAARKGKEWQVCFKDNGIGISPKYFDKIFVIFETLHAKSEYDGSGIGLAICKKIVEYHGGKIWVESEEGKGAAFYFTLKGVKQG